MKQSAMQELLEEIILEREKSISVEFREALDFVITAIKKDYIEQPKQETLEEAKAKLFRYSEEEVELIANEMVNWAIDNLGNPNPQSGKKFDEVLSKFKNK